MTHAAGDSNGGRVAAARLVSCVGVDLELALLPFFLDHYRGLGIDPARMHLIVNTADPASPRLEDADRILAERGVGPAERWIGPYTSEAMWERRRALQARVARAGEWVVNADVDEFHRYPGPLGEILDYLGSGGFGALQGVMIDRLSADGALAPIRDDVPLGLQFPVRADVALSVIGTGETHGVAGTTKLMVHRHDVQPRRGGHTVVVGEGPRCYAAGTRLSVFPHARRPDWRAAFPFQVDHYKWTATLRESLARRLATEGVSVAGREYGGKIDRYLATHGKVRVEDAALFAPEPPPRPDWRDALDALRRSAFYWQVRNAVRHKRRSAIEAVRRMVAT